MLRNVVSLVLVLAILLTVGSLLVSAAQPETEAANDALDYVRTLQSAGGGFPAFGTDSSAGATLDAVFAFAAAGINARTIRSGGNSPLDYLEAEAAAYSDDPGAAAKLVLGLVAMEQDPRDFAFTDFLAKMNSNFDSATKSYGEDIFDHELYMLARASLHLPPRAGSVDYLKSKQTDDGCWEFGAGWGCDTNTTALAIEALIAAGVSPSEGAVQDALDYLAEAQNDDGAWPYDPLSPWGTDSDANSTALVIQALVAAGEDSDDWDKGGTTPLQALVAFQLGSGALEWQPGFGENPLATYQAVPALLLQPFPVATMTLEEEEKTATPKPTKTPTATVTPITSPTATPLLPTAAPTVVAQPLSAAPTSEVAAIAIAPTGEGLSAGEGDGVAAASLMTFVLAGGGTLMAAGGLALRMRRR